MSIWIRIDPWAYLLAAALMLTLPLDWLIAAAAAAAFHEGCHLLAIRLLGGRVTGMRIGAGGAVIGTSLPGTGRELLCALAGPVGSLLLAGLYRTLPKLAICGGIQGLFNLLPVYPMDGGRALRCCIRLLWPNAGERLEDRVELGLILALAAAGAALLRGDVLWLLLPAALRLAGQLWMRKKPCKWRQSRVQ